MYIGWFFACLTGMVLPGCIFLLGRILDSFGPSNNPEETLQGVRETTAIMGILGVFMWITGYLQWSLTLGASIKIGNKIKQAYLEAILK